MEYAKAFLAGCTGRGGGHRVLPSPALNKAQGQSTAEYQYKLKQERSLLVIEGQLRLSLALRQWQAAHTCVDLRSLAGPAVPASAEAASVPLHRAAVSPKHEGFVAGTVSSIRNSVAEYKHALPPIDKLPASKAKKGYHAQVLGLWLARK